MRRRLHLGESLEETQKTVHWLKNMHVWGIVVALPLLAWALGEYHQRNKR